MKHSWIWVVVCMFTLQSLFTQWAYPNSNDVDQYLYEWTFEPKMDGTVHVKAEIALGESRSSYLFGFPEGHSVENIKALEVETGKGIEVIESIIEDKTTCKFRFDKEKEKRFAFVVEFDQVRKVGEKDGRMHSFYWEWTKEHSISHTATVILPQNCGLLFVGYLSPKEISSYQDRVSVTFEKDVSESGIFKFGVTFSGGTDNDGDGYSPPEDCDDNDPSIHPGAEEVCDGKDNDCDGEVDEDCVDKADIWVDKGCGSEYNYGDEVVVSFVVYSSAPTATVSIINYCGEESSEYIIENQEFPTNEEHNTTFTVQCLADQVRLEIKATIVVGETETELTNDCIFYVCFDNDEDGWSACEGDCDDNDPTIHPEAEEVCDEIDNDCDGEVDEVEVNLHIKVVDERDESEYPVEGAWVEVRREDTVIAEGRTPVSGEIMFKVPGNKEYTIKVSKGEKSIEESLLVSCLDDPILKTITLDVCEDADGDGYFSSECEGTDCDDTDPAVYPGAEEVCDGKDNDCDGEVDEDCVSKAKIWVDKGCRSTYSYGDEVVVSFVVYSSAPTATVSIINYCGDESSEYIIENQEFLTNEVHSTAFILQCLADQVRLEIRAEVVEGEPPITLTGDCIFYVYRVEPPLVDRNSVEIWIDRDCRSEYNNGDEVVVSFMVISSAPTATVSIINHCGETLQQIIQNQEFPTNEVHNTRFILHCPEDQARLEATLEIKATVAVGETEIELTDDCIFYVCFDNDEDGSSTCKDDCDDNDPAVYPGAEEVCDEKDNDCDGEVDNTKVDFHITVEDESGNPVEAAWVEVTEKGKLIANGETSSNGLVTFKVPGNKEYTIKVDKGEKSIEETHKVPCKKPGIVEAMTIIIPGDCEDNDRDGYLSSKCGGDDCNDDDPSIHPGVKDDCDGKDNDCDEEVDEDSEELAKIWVDKGCGSMYNNGKVVGVSFIVCSSAPTATVSITHYCTEETSNPIRKNRTFPTNRIHTITFIIQCPPGQVKLETILDIEAEVGGRKIPSEDCIFYVCFDEDNDGWSTCGTFGCDCDDSACECDCDDSNGNVHPGAKEICDMKDNNCDKWIPEALVLLVVFGGAILFLVIYKKKYEEKLFQGGGT